MEDRKILDPNGASAYMLEHAIFELQAYGYEITAWIVLDNRINTLY